MGAARWTYDNLEEDIGLGRRTVTVAFSGAKVPSDCVTEQIVRACGG